MLVHVQIFVLNIGRLTLEDKMIKMHVEKKYWEKHFEIKERYLEWSQCDRQKISKCLWKLPKNDFTRKKKDFDTFTKIA